MLVALICAAQLLPFLELLAHSQRDTGLQRSSDWSMPVWGWANFLVPLFRTSPTSAGPVHAKRAVLDLLLLCRDRNGACWWPWRCGACATGGCVSWPGSLFLGLVLALGNSGLLYRGLRLCFPGLGFVRYPVKFVILVLALAPLLAAFGFAALAGKTRRAGRFEFGCAAPDVASDRNACWLASKCPQPEGVWRATWQNGLARAAFLALVFLFTIACLKLGWPPAGPVRLLSAAGLLARFGDPHADAKPGCATFGLFSGLGQRAFEIQPAAPRSANPASCSRPRAAGAQDYAIAGLEENYLLNRLASLADCNLLEEVPQVHGFFSLTPREANDATVLPYVQTNRDFPALLDFMGVSQITAPGKTFEWAPRPSAMPLVTAGQRPVFADDRTAFQAFFQTNLDFRQIVFLPLEARGSITATQQTSARVLDARFANQSISIQTEAPAASLVVISQSYYPAWKAYVDGRPARIWRANYAFQALEVPAGQHQIQLVYQDRKLLAGRSSPASGCWRARASGCWLIWDGSARRGLPAAFLNPGRQRHCHLPAACHHSLTDRVCRFVFRELRSVNRLIPAEDLKHKPGSQDQPKE